MVHKKHLLWLLIIVLLLVWLNPLKQKPTEDEFISRELYDEWYEAEPNWSIKHFPPKEKKQYKGGPLAWNWSYTANSLVDMYYATGDEKYLGLLVPQAEYIFSQTDEKLGIESFTNTGVSLPAWSDGAQYTSGKYNYIYPVHTGMITIPILRFVKAVKENNITKYMEAADTFLKESGRALAIHNRDNMWKDFSTKEGFYTGHPHGAGIVSEANKIGVPNRIFAYLAACGLYGNIAGQDIYKERIEKSLQYFKHSLLKYDKKYDAYYWSYWDDLNAQGWEDISHAAVTVYGIYILHEEAGFKIFNKKELVRFANIVLKMVDEESPPKVRQYIHPLSHERAPYYTPKENPYYFYAARWSFLGIYNEKILERLKGVFAGMYYKEEVKSTDLFSVASYLAAQKKRK
jgi:hypothetical protein